MIINKITMIKKETTYTITFCDVGENDSMGMEKIGKMAKSGYTLEDLRSVRRNLRKQGIKAKIYNLAALLPDDDIPPAYLLVAEEFLAKDEHDNLFDELWGLDIDKMYYHSNKKKVLNKQARWNACFSYFSQEADYENGKGTIYNFDDLEFVGDLKRKVDSLGVSEYIPEDGDGKILETLSVAELNCYYNKTRGIGWHGDRERRLVIGVRIGRQIPLKFQWYQNKERVGDMLELNLPPGSLYIMSEKAVGYDWLRHANNLLTLRHSAGSEKYTK